MNRIIKLDYNLETPEERKALVEQILAETPEPSEKYLQILADYLVLSMDKQERKNKKLLTENRMLTVNKRETSFEGLVSQLENGEDGIYSLIKEDKNTIFQPKISITKQDLEEIPFLQENKDAIDMLEAKMKTVEGRDKYIIKQALIDLRKNQYLIKDAYRRPIKFNKITRNSFPTYLPESYTITPEGEIKTSGITLCDPRVCSAILCNYSKLKEDSYDNFDGDLWYLIYDFEKTCDLALEKKYPLYYKIVEYKIDGLSNLDIQSALFKEFGVRHSFEYISSLWRKKIPSLIADTAREQLLNWHFTEVEKGTYKRCTRCGKVKLANNMYFSKNNTSKDGFYSICKECRNHKSFVPGQTQII